MAVTDLWHLRDARPCPECRSRRGGSPSSRHGRGLRWRVSVPGQPSRAFSARPDAEAWEASLLSRHRPSGPARTVGELVALYMAGKVDLSRGGLNALRSAEAQVLARWEWVNAADVEKHEAQAWVAGLQSQTGPKLSAGGRALKPAAYWTKVKALQVLRGALAIAVDLGALEENPTDGVTVGGRGEESIPIYLTVRQVEQLARAAGEFGPMIWLMATIGPRIGEVVALDVRDVDVAARKVLIRKTKSGRARRPSIPPKVFAMLDVERPESEPLFTMPSGARIDKDHFRARYWWRFVKEAGLDPELGPHDLRHTAAALMIRSGASVKDVQTVLGHSSAKVTLDTYAQLWSEDNLDVVAAKMDELI